MPVKRPSPLCSVVLLKVNALKFSPFVVSSIGAFGACQEMICIEERTPTVVGDLELFPSYTYLYWSAATFQRQTRRYDSKIETSFRVVCRKAATYYRPVSFSAPNSNPRLTSAASPLSRALVLLVDVCNLNFLALVRKGVLSG